MIANNNLRFHIINVGHGDGILVEFPDLIENGTRKPRFGLIDAGSEDRTTVVKNKVRDYIERFLTCRLEGAPSNNQDAEDYVFEFICLTHPHADHLSGLMSVLERFCNANTPEHHKPREFWDCGFRYNTAGYLNILQFLESHPEIQFTRISSGTEFYYNTVQCTVLAPSVDLRNRYDTYGVDLNNASIILKFTKGQVVGILAGDSHFESWGKVSEEFPRKKHMIYAANDKRNPDDEDLVFLSEEKQLNCHFLKVSHHGSKNGTSYEYIDELSPKHFAVTCDTNEWYHDHKSSWEGKFPHPITRLIIGEETDEYDVTSNNIPDFSDMTDRVGMTCQNGTMIYTLLGNRQVTRVDLNDGKNELPTEAKLTEAL